MSSSCGNLALLFWTGQGPGGMNSRMNWIPPSDSVINLPREGSWGKEILEER